MCICDENVTKTSCAALLKHEPRFSSTGNLITHFKTAHPATTLRVRMGNVKNEVGKEVKAKSLPINTPTLDKDLLVEYAAAKETAISLIKEHLNANNPEGTLKNPKMRTLIGLVAGLVGHFVHSPKAIGKFKAGMLALYDDFHELESRNDTRWSSTFKMLAKVWRLRTVIGVYFNIHYGDNKVQLTLSEWKEMRACICVLEAHHDVHIYIQGGRTSFVASTIEALVETRAMLNTSTFELSNVHGCELSPMGEIVGEEDPQYEHVQFEELPEVAQILVTVLRA
eukprot:gene5134-6246_t